MTDSFLTQLEQRTEQVKITLANLEAERVRIEGLIAQLQPLVPHYDALVAAERTLAEANVALDAPPRHQPPSPASHWGAEPQEQSPPPWNG